MSTRLVSCALLVALSGLTAPASAETTFEYGRFGTVTVYSPAGPVKHVALFVSGDGGWNKGVIDMARYVSEMDTLVLGLDILHYLKALQVAPEQCSYAAADFEAVSQYAQKKLGLPTYHVPVLFGYSSGATLVYAVLAQAPPNTFQGAISLGFCPDLEGVKPFCKGHGLTWQGLPKGKKGVYFLPAEKLEEPFVAMQGLIDQVCDPSSTKAFVASVKNGEIVELPKVGHGYSVPRNWLPQLKDAFARMTAKAAGGATAAAAATPAAPVAGGVDVSDLPLERVGATGPRGDTAAVIVSGDGGWASLDREVATVLSARGIQVTGLNSLQYFWNPKTPDVAGHDLDRICADLLARSGASRLILAGYSRGADVLPFMASRLPEELRRRIAVVALLGPSHSVAFEFHLADWLGGAAKDELPIKPEVDKLTGVKVLCVYGSEEKDSLCPELEPARATRLELSGAHHFGGDYTGIADAILKAAVAAPVVGGDSPRVPE